MLQYTCNVKTFVASNIPFQKCKYYGNLWVCLWYIKL